MEIVRAEYVARLLNTGEGDPVLIVHRGSADVVTESELEDPRYAGALRLVSREELASAREGDPTDEELEELARRLSTAVGNLGG